MRRERANPAGIARAVLLLAVTTVAGALAGSWLIGLAVGLAIVSVAQFVGGLCGR
jgi:hypothetical protein